MSRSYVSLEDRMKVMGPMLRAGMKQVDIAQECGMTTANVSDVKRRAIAAGLIDRADLPLKVNLAANYGSLRISMRPQSAKFRKWVLDSAPAGSTPADFLISIALDAYHEEAGE